MGTYCHNEKRRRPKKKLKEILENDISENKKKEDEAFHKNHWKDKSGKYLFKEICSIEENPVRRT